MRTEQALGEFYETHARDLWTYAYRVTNNAADADDVVQEAFLRLFKAERLPDDMYSGSRATSWPTGGDIVRAMSVMPQWPRRPRLPINATSTSFECSQS